MILPTLDIPEFGPERDAWFDEQLAGGGLPEIVAELLVLLGLPLRRPDSVPTVLEWLGAQRSAFLIGGVARLTESQRRDLTRYPWLLLDLQALIDAEGGDYWVDVASRSPEFAAAVAAASREFQLKTAPSNTLSPTTRHANTMGSLASGATASVPNEHVPNAAVPAESVSPWVESVPQTGSDSKVGAPSRRRINKWATLAAIAAAVAMIWVGGRTLFQPKPSPSGGWGWSQQDLLAGSPTSAEYLNRLADAGAKWRNKRPETKAEVGQRIRELRAGCQRLIDGEHPPLSEEQQAALKTLCRKWAGQFDVVLDDLNEDRQTPLAARAAIDEIVDKVVARLRSGKLS
ncbi:MAG: hypothetical protein ACKO38_14975 [Planctomycetota bacterium]